MVANPPFSSKNWSNGVFDSDGDESVELPKNGTDYGRLRGFGTPPTRNGDYAFLLHMIRSLKSKGKGISLSDIDEVLKIGLDVRRLSSEITWFMPAT